MALTSGYYNSRNGDRKYDAVQMASIFDGIIVDGVLATIGQAFAVKAGGELNLIIGTGRAWFHHTWTLNDNQYKIEMPLPPVINSRIDTVVLEVNVNPAVRENSIKIIEGTVATTPIKPKLTKSDLVNQYPLAYVVRKANEKVIPQSQITNAVGTSETPFVTGVLKTINIDILIAKWEAEWQEYFANTSENMEDTHRQWREMWDKWFTEETTKDAMEFEVWMRAQKAAYETWFNTIKDTLGEDAATSLGEKIVELEAKVDLMGTAAEESLGQFQQSVTEQLDSIREELALRTKNMVTSDKERKIFVSEGTPTGAKEGDLWVQGPGVK